MAISISLLLDGSGAFTEDHSGGGNDSKTMRYQVSGTDSEVAAGALVAQTAPHEVTTPTTGVDLSIDSIECEPGGIDDLWDFTVNYSVTPSAGQGNEGSEPGQQPFPQLFATTFDTGGGTFHITNSKGTTPYATFGEVAENWNGAINVDDDLVVNGVDVFSPQLRIDRTVAYPRDYVTDAFVNVIADVTGTTNSGFFFGRSPGEVLLLGASGQNNGQPIVRINYSFLVSKNESSRQVGGISGISKGGHDYVWVQYKRKSGKKGTITEPVSVYVERVYDSGNFYQLGIPGA